MVLGFGAVELLAVAGAMWGGWAAFAVAVMYLALAAAATRLLRRAPNTPCACLGSTSAPVTRGHIVLDLAAAFVALCAAGNAGSPLRLVGEHPEASLVLAALVGCCVALFGMVLGAAVDGRRRRRMTTAILATETVVLVLLTIVVAGLLRSHGEILRRLHALGGEDATGEPPAIATATGTVHDIAGVGLDDDAMQLADRPRAEGAHCWRSCRVVVSPAGTSGPRSPSPARSVCRTTSASWRW